MHYLPRQTFGGKVHLFGSFIQFNRSVLFEGKRGTIPLTVLNEVMRKVKPAVGYSKRNLVGADLDDCVVSAVKSMCRCVGAKQRCPGGPKFGVESSIHSYTVILKAGSSLSVNGPQHDVDGPNHSDDIGEEPAFAHCFERLEVRIVGVAHMHAVRLGGAVGDDIVVHHSMCCFN